MVSLVQHFHPLDESRNKSTFLVNKAKTRHTQFSKNISCCCCVFEHAHRLHPSGEVKDAYGTFELATKYFRSCFHIFHVFETFTMTLGFRPALVTIAEDVGFSERYMKGELLHKDGIWTKAREYFTAVLERMLLYVINSAQDGNRDPELPDLRLITRRILKAVSNFSK